ncbi:MULTISPECIES: hypothetical protein [Mumia]|uniref:PEP-CTERM protein-sorting domain-containing protein n=1 Tax=Mumia xiangluensis TaxID=1678900 RepID=A0ABW1QJ21_9ACTN|nr:MULTISPECIES: hypothetical protein [Mumia]
MRTLTRILVGYAVMLIIYGIVVVLGGGSIGPVEFAIITAALVAGLAVYSAATLRKQRQ